MDYNRLFTFTKVAELGSISAAARAIHRTQSAVTQQIQALEEDLGVKLFERREARIFLSPFGKQIYDIAETSFGAVTDAIETVRADLKSLRGRIRVAALNDQSTDFDAVAFICAFRRRFPLVDIALIFGTNEGIEELLLAGEVELGIKIVFSQKGLFECREVASGTHIFVAGSALLDEHEPVTRYEDIFSLPLIDFSDDFLCLRPWVLKNRPSLVDKMQRMRPNLVLTDHASVRHAVIEGLGAAVLPQHLIATDISTGRLRPVVARARNLRVGLDIAYRKSRPLRRVEMEFFAFAPTSSR